MKFIDTVKGGDYFFIWTKVKELDSTVSIATGYGLDDRGAGV
jgi:hypothetical protein